MEYQQLEYIELLAMLVKKTHNSYFAPKTKYLTNAITLNTKHF